MTAKRAAALMVENQECGSPFYNHRKECFYASNKGADLTDYFRKQHHQCCGCPLPSQGRFKDILQELMEAEMDATPGYEKTEG